MPWTGPDTSDQATYQSITLPNRPPRGYGWPGALRFRFTLVEWAKKPEVRRTWQEIAERYGLREKELGDVDRVFGFTGQAVATTYPFS